MVVDNGSTDGSAGFVRSAFPSVRVLALDHNLGFGGGNNAGVRAAATDIVVLLNNDMVVDPGFLPPLLRPFAGEPRLRRLGADIPWMTPAKERVETGLTGGEINGGRLLIWHSPIAGDDTSAATLPVGRWRLRRLRSPPLPGPGRLSTRSTRPSTSRTSTSPTVPGSAAGLSCWRRIALSTTAIAPRPPAWAATTSSRRWPRTIASLSGATSPLRAGRGLASFVCPRSGECRAGEDESPAPPFLGRCARRRLRCWAAGATRRPPIPWAGFETCPGATKRGANGITRGQRMGDSDPPG